MFTVPKNVTPETLNLIEDVLKYAEEELKSRAIRVSTVKCPADKVNGEDDPLAPEDLGSKHVYLKAVGTKEIERVFSNVRYQLECEATGGEGSNA